MSERDEGVVDRDAVLWSYVAQVEACKARIEAMKAANDARRDQGYAQAYGEQSFAEQADLLDVLAGCFQGMVT